MTKLIKFSNNCVSTPCHYLIFFSLDILWLVDGSLRTVESKFSFFIATFFDICSYFGIYELEKAIESEREKDEGEIEWLLW